jgi:hypothetical protein
MTAATSPPASEQAQEKAQQAAERAQTLARYPVDRRTTEAGEKISGTAEDLRSVGEELRKQGKDGPARLAEQAASRAERVGSYLSESDADAVLGDLEDFGRRRPVAVLAGGIALGMVAARFLKASSRRRYEQAARRPDRSDQQTRELGGTGVQEPLTAEPALRREPQPTRGAGVGVNHAIQP